MNASSISSISPSVKASAARAADGDYKTKGVGHEVKDADGDYKPTKPTVSAATSAAASASSAVRNAVLGMTKGGA